MSETDGRITNKEIDYFENLSKNNLGMIIVETLLFQIWVKALNEIVLENLFTYLSLKN